MPCSVILMIIVDNNNRQSNFSVRCESQLNYFQSHFIPISYYKFLFQVWSANALSNSCTTTLRLIAAIHFFPSTTIWILWYLWSKISILCSSLLIIRAARNPIPTTWTGTKCWGLTQARIRQSWSRWDSITFWSLEMFIGKVSFMALQHAAIATYRAFTYSYSSRYF